MNEPSFYVDECRNPGPKGRLYCHLMSDGTEAELIAFALRLGLRRDWLQKGGTETVHFDLTAPKREAAIRAGARAVGSVEMFRTCVLPKRRARAERELQKRDR